MNTTNKLLDMYIKTVHAKTLAEAAKMLGLTGPALSNWRNGTSHAQPEAVEKMAKACGLDAEEWVLLVQADREVVAARKQVWLRAAKRLASAAALVTFAIGLDVYPSNSHASTHGHADFTKPEHVYIMRRNQRWLNAVAGALGLSPVGCRRSFYAKST